MGLLRNILVRIFGPPDPALVEWSEERQRIAGLDAEIDRLRRNKKRFSHKLAERDALIREAAQ